MRLSLAFLLLCATALPACGQSSDTPNAEPNAERLQIPERATEECLGHSCPIQNAEQSSSLLQMGSMSAEVRHHLGEDAAIISAKQDEVQSEGEKELSKQKK